PFPASAQNVVCDHMSPTLRAFGTVTDKLVTKLSPTEFPGEPWGTSVYRPACTRRSTLAATWTDPILVGTEATGAALRFTHGTIAGSTCWNSALGDLVTGGGSVTGIDPECIDGTIDTTGT